MFFGESKTLKKLADSLRTELSAIQKTIKEHEGAISNASETANEKQGEIPRVIAAGIRSTENEASYEHAQRDKEYRQQQKIMLVTLGAFVAAAVYAGVAIWQACLTRQALKSTEKFAILDQRPYVYFDRTQPIRSGSIPWGSGVKITVSMGLANFGKSPALHVTKVWDVLAGGQPLDHADRWFEKLILPIKVIPSPRQLGVYLLPTNDVLIEESIMQGEKSQLGGLEPSAGIEANSPYLIVARIQYRDTLGNLYWSDLCLMPGPTTPAGLQYIPCLSHNEIH
jgi:hypothetical protein